jgi:hypothetical protein
MYLYVSFLCTFSQVSLVRALSVIVPAYILFLGKFTGKTPCAFSDISSPGQVMCNLWWTKLHWGRFSPSTSVSPANSHSTDSFTFIIIRGWYNRPVSGRRTKWTQSHPTPRKLKTTSLVWRVCQCV